MCVQLVFVVFVRTDLFVEQNRRTKPSNKTVEQKRSMWGPLRALYT
jgi:hypothetical protein